MKDKTKKQIMIATIVILSILVIYLYLHQNIKYVSSGNSGSSNSNNLLCNDGNRVCTTTCIDRPASTTTPSCSDQMTSNGANHYSILSQSTAYNVLSDSTNSCRSSATASCSYASNIKVVGNCCFWYC